MSTGRRAGLSQAMTAAMFVVLIVVVVLSAAYVMGGFTTQPTSTTNTSSGMKGVVAGYVSVGPSQPTCSTTQSCNVNMSGYSIVFTPKCAGSSAGCGPSTAPLSPSGHYSILLPAGNYTVTGLSPSCQWPGCSSAFPKDVTVQGGMQITLDFNIDTGIR